MSLDQQVVASAAVRAGDGWENTRAPASPSATRRPDEGRPRAAGGPGRVRARRPPPGHGGRPPQVASEIARLVDVVAAAEQAAAVRDGERHGGRTSALELDGPPALLRSSFQHGVKRLPVRWTPA